MARLIDADALYKRVVEHKVQITGAYSKGYNAALNAVKSDLHSVDATPTVDAQPVVHGRFDRQEYIYGTRFICSVCECKCTQPYNYCPKCGAKMDEDEEL